MEAAGVPRLDVERFRLVRRSTRGTGQRGPSWRDKSGVNGSRLCRCGGRGTKRAPLGVDFIQLRARDAGVLSSSSDPS